MTQKLCAESVGLKTYEESQDAIQTLRETIDDFGCVNWPEFWQKREIARSRVFLTSRSLESVPPEIRQGDLGLLHLDKACSGLEAVGIRTVGELIDAARSGLGKLRNFGAKAHHEVVRALQSLSIACHNGIVDWLQYATSLGFDLVPPEGDSLIADSFFDDVLPAACEKVICSQFDKRAWLVFSKRLLASKEEHETLDSIGKVYGITRERVRQIEDLCLDALRRPLLEDNYRGLSFRFRPELAGLFRAAKDQFDLLALPAWTRTRWLDELSETWCVPVDRLAERYRLLAEIFGYRAVRLDEPILDSLIVRELTATSEVRRMTKLVSGLHDLLKSGEAMDTFSIAKLLIKNGHALRGVDEVSALVDLCSSAESIGENLYRLRFDCLKGRGNQVARVLAENGAPMHYRDLLREINRRLPLSKRARTKENVVNQISGDSRVSPIGKSGRWALAEWGLETRSLIELIEDVLATAGEAQHVDDITEQVLKLRPGSEASIIILLATHPRQFRKVAPHIYTLTSWGDDGRDSKWLEKDDVARFVASFFQARGAESVDFRDLQEAFSEQTQLSARSARGILAHHPAVQIERPDYHTRIASYRQDWSRLPSRGRKRYSPLQTDVIVDAAKAKLRLAPTGERPLVEIVKELEAELGIGRPNIYSAIGQSDELEKIAVEGSVFRICRIVGRSFPNFPQLADLRNIQWRQECDRAIGKLNLDDVDMGLFLLGRQFDQAMRYLLESARDNAGAPVLDGHLSRLQNRIDWAVSKGVFRDKATLSLLKNERNERGHEPPTLEERQAIMKFAPFLAGLYIDYLIMIDVRVHQIHATGRL